MNKQLIEELRLDAEWWFSHKPSTSPINDWRGISLIRNEWGWNTKECYSASHETESWFNLLIAEALEKE